MRLSKRVVQLERLFCQLPGLGAGIPVSPSAVSCQRPPVLCIEFRQTGIGWGVVRIFLNRILKILLRPHHVFRCVPVGVSAASQVGFVDFRIHGSGGGEARLLLRRQLDRNLARNVSSDFPLHDEDIPLVEFIAFSPQMAFRHRLDQVGRDANFVSGAEHSAFEQRIYLEFLRNLWQRFRGVPVADHRLVR